MKNPRRVLAQRRRSVSLQRAHAIADAVVFVLMTTIAALTWSRSRGLFYSACAFGLLAAVYCVLDLRLYRELKRKIETEAAAVAAGQNPYP